MRMKYTRFWTDRLLLLLIAILMVGVAGAPVLFHWQNSWADRWWAFLVVGCIFLRRRYQLLGSVRGLR